MRKARGGPGTRYSVCVTKAHEKTADVNHSFTVTELCRVPETASECCVIQFWNGKKPSPEGRSPGSQPAGEGSHKLLRRHPVSRVHTRRDATGAGEPQHRSSSTPRPGPWLPRGLPRADRALHTGRIQPGLHKQLNSCLAPVLMPAVTSYAVPTLPSAILRQHPSLTGRGSEPRGKPFPPLPCGQG